MIEEIPNESRNAAHRENNDRILYNEDSAGWVLSKVEQRGIDGERIRELA